MSRDALAQFDHVWLLDFEFCAPDGHLPEPLYFAAQNILSDCVTGLAARLRGPSVSYIQRGPSILSFSGLGSHQLGMSFRGIRGALEFELLQAL